MLNREFIAGQNPWWAGPSLIDDDEKVKAALSHKRVREYSFPEDNLIILGGRQVGKTTFMKLAIRELLKKGTDPRRILFFSCETLSGKDDILELASYFDEISGTGEGKYLFLDEITFVEDWNVAILGLFNSGYMRGKRIWVTGSSSVALQKETLPGRNIKKLPFYPMGFRDYVNLFYKKLPVKTAKIEDVKGFHSAALGLLPHVKDLNRMLDNYAFVTGGFLSASYRFFDTKEDPFDYYYETYKDAVLSDLSKLGLSERTFRETLYGILSNYGSAYSANSISKASSIGSHKTVEAYIEMMSKLFVLDTIFKRQNGRVMYRSNKKSYIRDPFIYRVMRFYSTGAKQTTEREKPSILEGVVGESLVRIYGDGINYLRTKADKEVDFMVDGFGVEVKYGNAKIDDLNTEQGYVITGRSGLEYDGKRLLLPASVFLYLL